MYDTDMKVPLNNGSSEDPGMGMPSLTNNISPKWPRLHSAHTVATNMWCN